MVKQVLALTAVLLCASVLNAQYDTLWIGTADGPSTSLANTPFPTEVHRAARTQYLVRSEVLQALGLWPNQNIDGICLQVVDDDAIDPDCLVDLHVTMKNEGTGNLNDLIYSGLVWTAQISDVHLEQGILGLNFNTSPWQWLGVGNNMDVEINWERGEAAGLNPRILLDTGLTYNSTYTIRTEQALMGSSLTSSSPDIEMESDNSLPILGLLVTYSAGVGQPPAASPIHISPVPANAELIVRSPCMLRDVRVVDTGGRTLLRPTLNGTTGTIDVSALPSGCYVLRAHSADGDMTSTRFIKE